MNVRCCCNPEKILGTIEFKSDFQRPIEFMVPIVTVEGVKPYCRYVDYLPPLPIKYERIEIRKFRDFTFPGGHLREELAVYSDDRPIEFWKQFPTFRPLEKKE